MRFLNQILVENKLVIIMLKIRNVMDLAPTHAEKFMVNRKMPCLRILGSEAFFFIEASVNQN